MMRRDWAVFLLSGIGIALAYQNCTLVNFSPSFSASSDKGGYGFEGKVYYTYGLCDGVIEVRGKIYVANDFSTATVLRRDCQNLPNPQAIPFDSLLIGTNDKSVIAFDNQIFDLVTAPSAQKVTIKLCEADGIQTLIWKNVIESTQLYGSVSRGDGIGTGSLLVDSPTPANYRSTAGQSSQFDLSLTSPSAGTLNYAVGGGSQVSTAVSCLSQSAPMTLVQFNNGGYPNTDVLATASSPGVYSMAIPSTRSANLIVVALTYGGQQLCTVSVSDDAGNIYVSANAQSNEPGSPPGTFAGAGSNEIWYASNSKPGATTLTVTACGEPEIFELEISGARSVNPLSGVATLSSQPASESLVAPKVTTSSTNAFVLSVVLSETGMAESPTPPFRELFPIVGARVAYYFANSPGSYGAVWNSSAVTYGASTVVFSAGP